MFSFSGPRIKNEKCENAGIAANKGEKMPLWGMECTDLKILSIYFFYNKKFEQEKNFLSQNTDGIHMEKKKSKNQKKHLCNKYENSGLKNVDIFTKVASLQCSWIKRLFDNNFNEWKAIPFYLVCRNWRKYSKFHSNLEMSCSVWWKFPKFYQELFLDGVNILRLQLHYHQQ